MTPSALFHNVCNSGGGHYIKQLELMRYLAQEGTEVTYVSPSGFDGCKDINHVPDWQLDFPGMSYATHLFSVLVVALLRSPDRFVPFTLFGGFVGAIVSLLRPGTQTVLFVRGDLFTGRALAGQRKYRLLKRFSVGVEWVTFRFVDRIVFISEQNREMMLERTGLTKDSVDSVVLYNNVYTDRVRKQLDEAPEALDGDPVLGFAGGFPTDSGKGIRYLIEAVAILSERFPEVQLYLLGDGGNVPQLKSIARRYGVGNHVHFTGWVEQPIPYLRAFDLFVLPSLHEGLGNALLESLAAGTPVVGSDVGGIPEVVGDEDYVFQPRSAEAIADTVTRVVEREEAYERARRNCRRQREVFDFEWAEAAASLVSSSEQVPPARIPAGYTPLRATADNAGRADR